MTVCACGRPKGERAQKCQRCHNNAAQRRYAKTAKGKAVYRKFRTSGKGRTLEARCNAQRLFIGQRYVCHAKSVDTARAINAHIKERRRAFKRQQAGTQTESGETGTVPADAITSAD